jgi:nicotinamidase-related amidase
MIDEQVEKYLNETQSLAGRKQAVLFGIETHVCILQTALDLIERGYQVHVVADGASSRQLFDRNVAFDVCTFLNIQTDQRCSV